MLKMLAEEFLEAFGAFAAVLVFQRANTGMCRVVARVVWERRACMLWEWAVCVQLV